APVDFEHETLADGLTAAGFNRELPTFFTWLGVVPYLTEEAIWSTLTYIGRLQHGAHVVFDYSDPPASFSPDLRLEHDRRAARVAALGEAWISYFERAALRSKLIEVGFAEIEDLGPPEISARYFPGRVGSPPEKGGHVVHASRAE